ncbi:tetratricopeptide repeat protein [Rhodopirellula sp. MGV]|uniref:tetratricopeptide repeat protein n=1 Tax=Rhodopirellula sp. MGV TaxID=2023130 RepID=UPI001304690E|nr:tetratricopeptide repeat protein [Rhodopirellula sp. MGV]
MNHSKTIRRFRVRVLVATASFALSFSGCTQPTEPSSSKDQAKLNGRSVPPLDVVGRPEKVSINTRPSERSPALAKPQRAEEETDPVALQDAAIEALERGDLVAAYDSIRQANRIAPEDPQTVFLLARVLAERNRFPEAIQILDELAMVTPDARLPILGQTAEWMVIQGDWEQAETRYQSLLTATDGSPMVHRKLAELYLREGRRSEAFVHLRSLCQYGNVEEAELRALLNQVHPFTGELSEDEQSPIGVLGIARHLIGQGDWVGAHEALSKSPNANTQIQGLRGRVAAHLPDTKTLADWYKENESFQSTIEDNTSDHWFGFGMWQASQMEWRKAAYSFGQALKLDPTDAEAYQHYATALKSLGMDRQSDIAQQRFEWLAKTKSIGSTMAIKEQRNDAALGELVDCLDQLRRPLESVAWQAIRVVYAQQQGTLSAQQAREKLESIRQQRQKLDPSGRDTASASFILCDIELEQFLDESSGDETSTSADDGSE